jgi:hypothetical protein
MAFDQAAVIALRDALVSHAQKLGIFERVAAHEPKSQPGNGISCVIWAQDIRPLPGASGLNATSGYVVWHARLLANMLAEPQDSIETDLLYAATTLMGEYSGNFTLGGLVRNIDLLGQFGESLSMQAGYLDIDRKFFRVATVVLPMVVNDLWTQAA